MAALAPPQNAAGVPRPAVPANPASLVDITNAKEYIDRLSSSKLATQPNAATDVDIGAAEAYKAAIVFSHSPGANAAPAWLINLNATIQQIAADVAYLRRKSDELPIFLANSQAGPRGPLFNPTAMQNGWALPLVAPNPRTRDELLSFTTQQCIASADDLGLLVLPPPTNVLERRRQIAVRIGVTID